MKKGKQLFPGVILIGFGLFFLLEGSSFQHSYLIFNWPTMITIIGIAFLVQAYAGKEHELILPGVLFLGLGVHFFVAHLYGVQLDHIGVILLLIALGFFLRQQKTKVGFIYGLLFLILSLFRLFYSDASQWLGKFGEMLTKLESLWPFLLIAAGAYLFLFKRR
jgi:hypothetical protein